jgi:hypothetical protein
MNQHLETMLRAYIEPEQKDWLLWLGVLKFAYNNAIHSSHHLSPAKLLLGYKPRSPLDFLVDKGLTASEGSPNLQKRVRELNAHRTVA